MIALGRELAARGHAVTLQTWRRWQADVEREGMAFAAAPEYHVFPTRERPMTPYQAVEGATRETVELVRAVAPAVVMADILTLAPALAGELEGVPGGMRGSRWGITVPTGTPSSSPASAGASVRMSDITTAGATARTSSTVSRVAPSTAW